LKQYGFEERQIQKEFIGELNRTEKDLNEILDHAKEEMKKKEGTKEEIKSIKGFIYRAIERDYRKNKSSFEIEKEKAEKKKKEQIKKSKQDKRAIAELKKEYDKFYKSNLEEVFKNLSEKRKKELEAEFKKTELNSDFARKQYKKSGLDDSLIKAGWRNFVAKKELSEEERVFEIYATNKLGKQVVKVNDDEWKIG